MTLKILLGSRRFNCAPSFFPFIAPAFLRFSCQFCAAQEHQLAWTSAHLPIPPSRASLADLAEKAEGALGYALIGAKDPR